MRGLFFVLRFSAAVELQLAVYQLVHEAGAIKADIVPIRGFVYRGAVILRRLAELVMLVDRIGAGRMENLNLVCGETALAGDKLPGLLVGHLPAGPGIEGRDQEDVFRIMDDLMDTLQVANPRVYNGVVRKIRSL